MYFYCYVWFRSGHSVSLCCSVYCLCVCECVLYCCHWVSTQLQLTNIYHIVLGVWPALCSEGSRPHLVNRSSMHTGKNITRESVYNLNFMTSTLCEEVTTDFWRRLTISWSVGCFIRVIAAVAWGWPLMSVYLAAVQLRMSGFEVSRFCERLPRAARQTVQPVRGKDGFFAPWSMTSLSPYTYTSSVTASGYYCTSLPGRVFRRETTKN